jgi:hypothetical protein
MRASVLLCIPILFLLAVEARAQCRVEGVVRLADGTPLAGATVRIDGEAYRQPLTTTTDAEGRYAFADVKAGTRVRIVASQDGRAVAQGYALVTLWVENVDLKEQLSSSTESVTVSEGPSGEVAGFVLSADGRPVPAARVTVGETTLITTTDSAGRYLFGRLRPGVNVELHVSAPGFQPESNEVAVLAGDRLGVDFALEAEPPRELSGAQLSTIEMSADGSRLAVRPEQVAGIPSLSRNDVFRALQFLPGVAGSMEASADLYVRGGTPDQTLVTVDGFTVYQFADVFGPLSAYNMNTVHRAEFSKSPFGAGDGGRLAGVLRLTGQPNPSGRASGSVDLSVLGVGALLNVAAGDRVAIMIAARRSPPTSLYNNVLDQFGTSSGVSARDRLPRFSGGSFPDAPASSSYFRDVNSRLELKLTDKDRLSLSLYDGRDDANNSHDLAVPESTSTVGAADGTELPSNAVVQVSNVQDWTARGLSGTWVRRWSASASTTASISRSDYVRSGDQAWLLTSLSTGKDYSFVDSRGGSSALSESNQLRETTLRVDSSLGLGFAHLLSVGGELSSLDVSYSSLTEAFRSTSGGAFTSSLVGLLHQAGSGNLTAVYAQDAWRPLARLILSPGMRVARYDRTSSTYFEPRASASYQLLPQFRLQGGWAIDHQMTNRITREDRLHGDGAFWALADGAAIPVARAQQVVGGGSVDVRGVLFDVEAYYKTLDDLTIFAPRLYTGVAPKEGSTLLYRGSGTAQGVEALLQQKVSRNTLWVSYTLSRVEYTFPTLETGTFPASYDRTNELKVANTVELGARWSLSGAFVAGTGRPFTPASGVERVWFPSGATVYNVTFDSKNSARLPAYHRLDLSTERDFLLGGVKSSVGATVFNVYGRKNILLYEYETAGQSLTGHEVTRMGRAVSAFVRVGF